MIFTGYEIQYIFDIMNLHKNDPIHKKAFWVHFVEGTYLYFDQHFADVCPQGSNSRYVNIG